MKFFIKDLSEVDEALRGLYKKVEGGFQLDVDVSDSDEFKKLKNNRDEILAEKREEQRKRKEAEEKAEKEALEKETAGAKTREEFDAVMAKERAKAAKELADANAISEKRFEQLKKSLVDGAISALATELAGDDAALLLPHIQSRVQTEEVDGELRVVVLDKNGSKTHMDVKALGDDMKQDKMYASIVKGRQSSGGGSGSGSGSGSDFEKYFDPKNQDYSIMKQIELEDSNPALYKELSEKFSG